MFVYFLILGFASFYCLFLGDLSIVIIFSQSILRWECYSEVLSYKKLVLEPKFVTWAFGFVLFGDFGD